MSETVLKVEHLKKYYPVRRAAFSGEVRQVVRACDDVSFELHAGDRVAVSRSPYWAQLICGGRFDFFGRLRRKLEWGER